MVSGSGAVMCGWASWCDNWGDWVLVCCFRLCKKEKMHDIFFFQSAIYNKQNNISYNLILTLIACLLAKGKVKLGDCQLNAEPWRLESCWDWDHSLACSIFLRKRHWNKISSSGRVEGARVGITYFWDDTAWTESDLVFSAKTWTLVLF